MTASRWKSTLGAMAAAGLMLLGSSGAIGGASEGQELVDRARYTVEKIMVHKDLAHHVKDLLPNARGVMIVPDMLKGGIGIGGEGGSGVLLARRNDGGWGYPAFFRLGAASVGVQFGFSESEIIFLIMTEDGLQSVLKHNVKLGGEVNFAAGPEGVNVGASTTTGYGEDIISYAVSRGLFAGMSLEGGILNDRQDLNAQYYGDTATPKAIVLEGAYSNPGADQLRATLARY